MNIRINDFAAVDLCRMAAAGLMNRVDTKFVAPAALLPQLLEAMRPLFRIQLAADSRIARYATQYFDTPELDFYLMHQNGKLNLRKIRIRSYLDTCSSFLEIKDKDNRGRANKRRVPATLSRTTTAGDWGEEERRFLEQSAGLAPTRLVAALENRFRRMTFVNAQATERITIDTDLAFLNPLTGKASGLEKLMILELKQNSRQRSDFGDILRRLRIRPCAFSKYCIGSVLTNPGVKYNRFKSKMQLINKLVQ